VQIVEEKYKNSKGKRIKEDYLKIKINNATAKPKIHLFDKPGVTHYGSSEPNLHKSGYNFSFQYSYLKRFLKPYIIVEAGNEVVIVKLPYE
jgi:HKD family nuclease